MPPDSSHNPDLLLVLHQGAIGDFVLALAVVQSVREFLGAGSVEVIASAASARLAAGRSVVTRCYSPEAVGLHTLFCTGGREASRPAGGRACCTPGGQDARPPGNARSPGDARPQLDARLQERLQSAVWILSFLSDSAGAVHGRLQEATGGVVVSIDPRPSPETAQAGRHITQQWTQAIRQAGWAIGPATPPVIRVEPRVAEPDSRPQVIIHPGSGGKAKCWPVEQFFKLADSLRSEIPRLRFGLVDPRVAWLLGPAEREMMPELFGQVTERANRCGERLVIEDDLAAAAQRIGRAALYIGHDAGMTHVAVAMGIPTVAIFVSTDPRVWAPLGGNVRVIERPSGPKDLLQLIAGGIS